MNSNRSLLLFGLLCLALATIAYGQSPAPSADPANPPANPPADPSSTGDSWSFSFSEGDDDDEDSEDGYERDLEDEEEYEEEEYEDEYDDDEEDEEDEYEEFVFEMPVEDMLAQLAADRAMIEEDCIEIQAMIDQAATDGTQADPALAESLKECQSSIQAIDTNSQTLSPSTSD